MRARSSRSRSNNTEESARGPLAVTSVQAPTAPRPSNLHISSSSNDLPDPISDMISAATNEAISSPIGDTILTDIPDIPDNHSSSLSELDPEEVSDDDNPIYKSQIARQLQMEVDSEAETERLDKSPHKDENVEASMNDEQAATEALLGLSHAISAGPEISVAIEAPSSSLGPTQDSSPSLRSAAITLGKRKRASPGASSLSDGPLDEPLPKRTLIVKDEEQMDSEIKDMEDEPSDVEKLDDAVLDADLQDLNDDVEESNSEERIVDEPRVRPDRGKGKRKGRRNLIVDLAETVAEASDTPLPDVEDIVEDVPEEPEEEEEEEEEEGSHDEESAKRKEASEALVAIERDFLAFRQKYVSEQLRQIDKELDLLSDSECTHPDFIAMMASVDDHRDGKFHYERSLLRFNLTALANTTVAERQQFHSQFYQDVRDIKDKALYKCNMELYALQRERRRFGTRDRISAQLYNPSRLEQVRWHTSFNLEASILAGIAHNVGFPAAPSLYTCSTEEIEQDLQIMGGANRAATGVTQSLQPSENQAAAAEEQFLEQTPWANPQHPAHGNSLNSIMGFGVQRRSVDTPLAIGTNVTNGSSEGFQAPQRPPTPPQQSQQPQPPSQSNFAGGRPAAPSFHVIANNQLYKVPVAEVVHPSTGMVINSVTDPSSSPILGAIRSASTDTGAAKSGRGKRPTAGTIIIMKDFESPRSRRASTVNNVPASSSSSSPPKATYQPQSSRSSQPAGFLPFTPSAPVNVVDVQPPVMHSYQHQDRFQVAPTAKDVDLTRNNAQDQSQRSGPGMVAAVGRFAG